MEMYDFVGPILRRLDPEFAHRLGLFALRHGLAPRFDATDDPSERAGLRVRNRVGIAAGFDKNGVALEGMERLGIGFVEVGTILVKPWGGNSDAPRLKRYPGELGIWNRLGFPSAGLEQVKRNLSAFPRSMRRGMLVACNIGPHPERVRSSESAEAFFAIARDDLTALVERLHEDADVFVVNLSSPNTQGLRTGLQHHELAERVLLPLQQTIARLDARSGRTKPTPLLLKLPPEDAGKAAWTAESLGALISKVLDSGACQGFVAVNTSTRLAAEFGESAGGVSGRPLLNPALEVIGLLRGMIGPDRLLIGSGGITDPAGAVRMVDAGADWVELYSGLIYRGPGLIPRCARALKEHAMSRPASLPLA